MTREWKWGDRWLTPEGENQLRVADTQPIAPRLRQFLDMKYKDEEYRRRETSAQKAAVKLLGLIQWRIHGEPALLPPALRLGLNAPDAGLVIMATGGVFPDEIEAAVRETRATVLVIEPGSTNEGAPTYYFTLVRCVAGEVCWTRALRLWLDLEGKPYLVPDLHGPDPDGMCFALEALGVAMVPPPWFDLTDRSFGVRSGDTVLLAL